VNKDEADRGCWAGDAGRCWRPPSPLSLCRSTVIVCWSLWCRAAAADEQTTAGRLAL